MKVFLSWSGDTSHKIAIKLHSWLPMVIQRVDPYISSEIDKGARWGTDIARELEQCSFGIACVTKENVAAPWLLFEAGALSKSVSDGKLAPLLCGINQTDVQKSPLTQFQMTKFEQGEFFKLLKSINECEGDNALDEQVLSAIFHALWPDLDGAVAKILKDSESFPAVVNDAPDPRQLAQALEEILTNSRAMGQLMASPERILPPEYLDHILGRGSRFGRRNDLQRAYSRVRQSLGLLEQVVHGEGDSEKDSARRAYEMLMDARFMLRDIIGGPMGRPPSFYRDRPVVERREESDVTIEHIRPASSDDEE